MCGITGFLTARVESRENEHAVLARMTGAIAHRGPDDQGLWQSSDGACLLGHRRLSIIDLSPAGAQPMRTRSERFVIVFNGEIYNYQELRAELESAGETFRGSSDTEVLLSAFERWGVSTTLPRLNGMFAFALWDQRDHVLWLSRDRFGEKPLYYAWHGETFLFGSELKSMMAHPAFRRDIAVDGVCSLVNFGYVPSPRSIFVGVSKLQAGHYLAVRPGQPPSASEPYWRPEEMLAQRGRVSPNADQKEVIDQLDSMIRQAVRRRMVADVPLGAFLSGGIDSSTVVALMQAQSTRPVKTFTIGFRESGYNEAEDAARVARHLKTEHHEFYLGSRECIDTILHLPEIYDEPFADSSQIPTTLVSIFTRRHVTVALSGDSGDEFFGGYNRYFWTRRLWSRFSKMPAWLRRFWRDAIGAMSPQSWERLMSATNHVVPRRYRVRGGGDKMHKLARILDARSLDAIYLELVSNGQWMREILPSAETSVNPFARWESTIQGLGETERMMLLDQMTYMTDDILCKVDRASMSVGLEARVPFLDPQLTDFAWSLPISLKVRDGVGKWPLRQVLKRYVPEKLFERPKMGFGIPAGDWLRGPLRDWAEDLLSEKSLADCGFFNARAVRRAWAEHLSGRRNLIAQLWSVLMFLAWRRRWIAR